MASRAPMTRNAILPERYSTRQIYERMQNLPTRANACRNRALWSPRPVLLTAGRRERVRVRVIWSGDNRSTFQITLTLTLSRAYATRTRERGPEGHSPQLGVTPSVSERAAPGRSAARRWPAARYLARARPRRGLRRRLDGRWEPITPGSEVFRRSEILLRRARKHPGRRRTSEPGVGWSLITSAKVSVRRPRLSRARSILVRSRQLPPTRGDQQQFDEHDRGEHRRG